MLKKKKQKKRKLLLTAILFLALLLAFLLSYFVFQIPLFDASGWHTTKEGTVQFRDYYARPQTGWLRIEQEMYYFDETGAMQTGWLEFEGQRYYLAENGAMHTGWLELDGKRYYLDLNGPAHTGWLKTQEGNYYFGEDHTMQTGWLTVEGTQYLLQDDGTAYTGWLTTETARYYMDENGAVATGFVTVNGQERYFLENGEYVPLINPWNPLSDDFQTQLVDVNGYKVDITCAEALQEMMAACKKAGNTVKINSAYRDLKDQQAMWEKYRKNYMAQGYSYDQAEKLTAGYVAVPGTSEHHTGLGIDIGTGSKTYAWLAEHCWEYGFILRYPQNKTGSTGFNYEPWHFRYLGKPLAEQVHKSGLTLEEYFESIR